MRRREFVAGLAGTVVYPVATRAQQPERKRHIAVLVPGAENDPEYHARIAAFADGMQQQGWNVGSNIVIDYRWGAGDPERITALAKELVEAAPEVIFTNGTAPTAALQRATDKIPIVFAVVSDPTGDGFVANLGQPSGNITGFSTFDPDIGGKWLELLHELAPEVKRVALLFNPRTAPGGGSFFIRPSFELAAQLFSIDAIAAPVHRSSDVQETLTAFARIPKGGLIVMPDSFTTANREAIINLAQQYHLPYILSGYSRRRAV